MRSVEHSRPERPSVATPTVLIRGVQKAARTLGQLYDEALSRPALRMRVSCHPGLVGNMYAFHAHAASNAPGLVTAFRSAGTIVPGDWDRWLKPFDQEPRYLRMVDLHTHRADFRESVRYRELVRAMESGTPFHRRGHDLSSLAGIERYCRYFLDLIESMETWGFQGKGARDPIRLAIARDGTVVKWYLNGFHRLAAAKIIGLQSVEAEVSHYHTDWMFTHRDGESQPSRGSMTEALGRSGLHPLE